MIMPVLISMIVAEFRCDVYWITPIHLKGNWNNRSFIKILRSILSKCFKVSNPWDWMFVIIFNSADDHAVVLPNCAANGKIKQQSEVANTFSRSSHKFHMSVPAVSYICLIKTIWLCDIQLWNFTSRILWLDTHQMIGYTMYQWSFAGLPVCRKRSSGLNVKYCILYLIQ